MDFFNDSPSLLWTVVLRLLGVVAALMIGRWLARRSRVWLDRTLKKTELTESLITLSTTSVFYGIWLFTVLVVLALLGVPVTSIVAVSGMTVIIVGIALRESLSDLAATVIFVLFKPFESGDMIVTNGKLGIVREIELFNTTILSPDNHVHVLANSMIQKNGATNYSKTGSVRVDLSVSISYRDDMALARSIVEEVMRDDGRVLDDPPMQVYVEELGDNGVNIAVRPFVRPEDYLQFQRDMLEPIKVRLETAGITIPFPQRDVHLIAAETKEKQAV